ncbi:MAG: cytidine deaminase, partial [Brachybacterium sp.]|nr:cytidine deaminase [Brachybacterium sp.]
VASRAYAPYSGFRVGAAAVTDDGRGVTGCNVENAAYGVTLCAECGLIGDLIAGGGGKIRRFVCVGTREEDTAEAPLVMPCGRCRQLLAEHAAADFRMLSPRGEIDLEALLPQAFGPDNLG